MNKHLPPSNIFDVAFSKPAVTEQFFILRGKREPFIDGDLMDRAAVIAEVAEDYSTLRQIIAFSLEAKTSRDATDEICKLVISRWAEDDKELSQKAFEFVEMVCGTTYANAFRVELV